MVTLVAKVRVFIHLRRSRCYGARDVYLILTKFEFSRQILVKFPALKFNEYPPSGSRVVP
jgi:hypothetical protein